jgi:hypothetical protein
MDETRKKSAVWKAIRAYCLSCAGDRAEVARCDGQLVRYECSLHAYRHSSIKKTDSDGRLLGLFFKNPMLKAIRQQCFFCSNGYDPRIACGDPDCSLSPYQRGTSSFTHVAKSVRKGARSWGQMELGQVAKVILPPPDELAFAHEGCAP